jgi:Uncharacterized protein conserved in bacteria
VSEQIKVPCVIMRGGTSKGVFFHANDIPRTPEERDRFLLAVFGSPDKRQIDGLGGADLLTSKCAIVAPSDREDADVVYTFAQVGIDKPEVSYDINCGNIISAVGHYAIDHGWIKAVEPITSVRVYNTNTDKVITLHVRIRDGEPAVEGDCRIDGVPGTSAEVGLDYSKTYGGVTGKLFPTGRVRDRVHVPLLGKSIDITIVDLGNLSVFFKAEDIGCTGVEMPHQFSQTTYDIFEQIRKIAGDMCGLDEKATMIPYQIMVAPPSRYELISGGTSIEAEDMDFVARMCTLGGMHKAFPVGGATSAAIAALAEGSVVHEVSGTHDNPRQVRIGHPSGMMQVYARAESENGAWTAKEVTFARTARKIMDGFVYVRKSRL